MYMYKTCTRYIEQRTMKMETRPTQTLMYVHANSCKIREVAIVHAI